MSKTELARWFVYLYVADRIVGIDVVARRFYMKFGNGLDILRGSGKFGSPVIHVIEHR